MKTGRLEAFSDGVLAIVITIMVLELKAPEDTSFQALIGLAPVFISYILSFIYIGIYWNNHHHLMQVSQKVNGKVLWANLHLLFWLSLIPFTTNWLGEHHHYNDALPVATYGFVLLMSAMAYVVLENTLVRFHDENHVLRELCKNSLKDYISIGLYIIGVAVAFLNTWVSITCYITVAIIWLIPSRKLETFMEE